jgi:hypothetical protein
MSKCRTAWRPEQTFHSKRAKYGYAANGGKLSFAPVSSLINGMDRLMLRHQLQMPSRPIQLDNRVIHIISKIYDSKARHGVCYFHEFTSTLIAEVEVRDLKPYNVYKKDVRLRYFSNILLSTSVLATEPCQKKKSNFLKLRYFL